MAEDLTIQRLRSLMEQPGAGRPVELQPAQNDPAGQPDPEAPSFSDTLKESIAEVNELRLQADQAIQDLAADKTQDVQGTILAMEKADVSFKMMMEVRNKLVSAYQEVMRTQV